MKGLLEAELETVFDVSYYRRLIPYLNHIVLTNSSFQINSKNQVEVTFSTVWTFASAKSVRKVAKKIKSDFKNNFQQRGNKKIGDCKVLCLRTGICFDNLLSEIKAVFVSRTNTQKNV